MSYAISFRPLSRCDFSLLERWLAEPHITAWWRDPDAAELEAKYGARIDGAEPVHMFIIEYEGRAIGWIQWYLWRDDPMDAARFGAPDDAAGIDLAIGERDMIERGVGPACIREFIEGYVFADSAVRSVLVEPEAGNGRSIRAFLKAGFFIIRSMQVPGEDFVRNIMILDRV